MTAFSQLPALITDTPALTCSRVLSLSRQVIEAVQSTTRIEEAIRLLDQMKAKAFST